MSKLHKVLEYIIEAFSSFKIVISPLLIGLFIGIVVYANKTNAIGLIIGIAITLIGLFAGIKLALWARKKQGSATAFNARINASPDIDEILKKDKK